MNTVCSLNQCTGCMACVESCAKNAIEIVDAISSYNAVIDTTKCVGCKKCESVCQVNYPPLLQKPIFWCEVWANSEDIRLNSSSGGYASAIEKAFIQNGGWVCSCKFENGVFGFSCVKENEEVKSFSGSKYVKSNPRKAYRVVKEKLNAGEKVLFVGLPCQSAALQQYIGRHRENLYTVDLICHGTPSPKVLESFLKDYRVSLSNIERISFRDKNHFQLCNSETSLSIPTVRDLYTTTFLKSTTYTENCYTCRYATLDRVSDISLGDSWGSELPKSEVNRGISFALVQSQKGMELLQMADLCIKEADLKRAVKFNHQLDYPSVKPKERASFMGMLEKGKTFNHTVRKNYPSIYYRNIIKKALYRLKIFRGGRK